MCIYVFFTYMYFLHIYIFTHIYFYIYICMCVYICIYIHCNIYTMQYVYTIYIYTQYIYYIYVTIVPFLCHSFLIKFLGRMWPERKQSGLLTSASHTWVLVFDCLWFPSCAVTNFRYAFMVRNSILFYLNIGTNDLKNCFCNTCLVCTYIFLLIKWGQNPLPTPNKNGWFKNMFLICC